MFVAVIELAPTFENQTRIFPKIKKKKITNKNQYQYQYLIRFDDTRARELAQKSYDRY